METLLQDETKDVRLGLVACSGLSFEIYSPCKSKELESSLTVIATLTIHSDDHTCRHDII